MGWDSILLPTVTYGHWRTAEEALARMADHDEHMHGLLIKTVDGNARRTPLVKIAADAGGHAAFCGRIWPDADCQNAVGLKRLRTAINTIEVR